MSAHRLSPEYQKGLYHGFRSALFEVLGRKCTDCGETDRRVLQVDHVQGGGSRHRREVGSGPNYYRIILREIGQHYGKYALVCANCNQRRRGRR